MSMTSTSGSAQERHRRLACHLPRRSQPRIPHRGFGALLRSSADDHQRAPHESCSGQHHERSLRIRLRLLADVSILSLATVGLNASLLEDEQLILRKSKRRTPTFAAHPCRRKSKKIGCGTETAVTNHHLGEELSQVVYRHRGQSID